MSTSAVSSSSLSALHQYFQTRQSDLKQLGQALANGDLAVAQAAFDGVVKLGQSGPFAKGDPFVIKQREQYFTAIGQGLQAGDLANARKAFSDLEVTLQRGGRNQSPATSPNAPLPAIRPSSAEPESVLNLKRNSADDGGKIRINISNQSGGGERVSIRYGKQDSDAQPVTFDLPHNSNEGIVLNLSSPTEATDTTGGLSSSTSGSTSTSGSSTGGLSVSA
jgi:hypothetical protein